jgi:hypothetical protein
VFFFGKVKEEGELWLCCPWNGAWVKASVLRSYSNNGKVTEDKDRKTQKYKTHFLSVRAQNSYLAFTLSI